MDSMFADCWSLKALDLSSFSTVNVESIAYMFNNCKSLRILDLRSFDLSEVNNKDKMFDGCPAKIIWGENDDE